MEHILTVGSSNLPLPADGAVCLYWYDWPWMYYWSGNDWGSGFLQADSALMTAYHMA